jgi:AraC-like DNA-binding protein
VIAAWVADPVARQRLTAAARTRRPRRTPSVRILWCSSADELYAAIADRGATAAVIELGDLTPDPDGADTPVERVVRTLRAEYPAVPLLAYVPLTAAASRAMLRLGRVGVVNAIIAGHDDLSGAFGSILTEAASVCVAEDAHTRLSSVASSGVSAILGYALQFGRPAPTVAGAARVLRVHRKTLTVWCRSSGAPSPQILVTWCRLIIAAERLVERRWATERVARALGFASGSALAGMFKRHLGLTRPLLRERGSGVVVEMLVRRLADGRSRADAAGGVDRGAQRRTHKPDRPPR